MCILLYHNLYIMSIWRNPTIATININMKNLKTN